MTQSFTLTLLTPVAALLLSTLMFPKDRYKAGQGNLRFMILFRVLSCLVFILLPAILISVCDWDAYQLGLNFDQIGLTFLWSAPFAALIFLKLWLWPGKKIQSGELLQVRTVSWGFSAQLSNGLTWIIYLLGYEFMLRGFLLFGSLEHLSPFYASLLNIAIYAAAHIPKGWFQVAASAVFGIVLCWVTLKSGNIWGAVLIHATLSLSVDSFSIISITQEKLSLSK